MPKFRVLVTRDCTETAVVTLEAPNVEAAEEAALARASDLTYTRDECYNLSRHAYTNGAEEV